MVKKVFLSAALLLIALTAFASGPSRSVDVYSGNVAQALVVSDGVAGFVPVELNVVFSPVRPDRGSARVAYEAAGRGYVFEGEYVRHGGVYVFHGLEVLMPSGEKVTFRTALDDGGTLEVEMSDGGAIYLDKRRP